MNGEYEQLRIQQFGERKPVDVFPTKKMFDHWLSLVTKRSMKLLDEETYRTEFDALVKQVRRWNSWKAVIWLLGGAYALIAVAVSVWVMQFGWNAFVSPVLGTGPITFMHMLALSVLFRYIANPSITEKQEEEAEERWGANKKVHWLDRRSKAAGRNSARIGAGLFVYFVFWMIA